MSRVADAIMNPLGQGGTAFSIGRTQPMLDLAYGGQQGYAPDLTQWVSNQAYVRKNVFCLLLEAPRFFQKMPDPQKWVSILKSLVELHPRTIEGLNGTMTAEFLSTPVGGAGEIQEEVVDVKREPSKPVFTFDEKYGMPIQTFIQDWMRYGMMDPDSKIASIGTLADRPDDMLADQYTMSCIFIEPDPQHRRVMKSWISTNMMPRSTGDIIGRRDLTAAGELQTLSIEFTALSQFNLGSNRLAQALLDRINLVNANPYLRPAFISGVAADVAAAAGTGYQAEAESLGAQALNRT